MLSSAVLDFRVNLTSLVVKLERMIKVARQQKLLKIEDIRANAKPSVSLT